MENRAGDIATFAGINCKGTRQNACSADVMAGKSPTDPLSPVASPSWARLAGSFGLTAIAFLLASSLGAQTYQVLQNFGGHPPGGAAPQAALIADASGNLYGTTVEGGLSGLGTVFKLDAANDYALTTLHSFSGPDGAYPRAAVMADASGNLYGTTSGGGPSDYGTVFRLDATNNYALTTLHTFGGSPDGASPRAAVIADASGNLYGTTSAGGAFDSGIVFKLDASDNYALTTLHTFSGPDGAYPYAAVIADASGNLYGTTSGAYYTDDHGTVFKLDASNNYALTTLHTFGGPDGAYPYAAVIADASGNLYGTTEGGGFWGLGTVFKLDAANNYALTTIHVLWGNPTAGVIADASGNLYGTTNISYPGSGIVFRLDAANNYALTTLHTFSDWDGATPSASLIADSSGNLYGTTAAGNAHGSVFRLDSANSYALTTLHSFGNSGGESPYAALIADAWGNLYGTTSAGGASGFGTVFKLDAANSYALTTLHSFEGPDGMQPYAALFADASGSLYGTTLNGGLSGSGTVFKLDAANNYALTTLHSFGGPDGAGPRAAVIGDALGNLYGTTSGGGAWGYGTVFKLDAGNGYALTTLHSFGGSDGAKPSASLIAGAAGNLYGTTSGSYGSGDDFGTVFRLETGNNNALTTLHRFGGADGYYPSAIIADAAGNLYGSTYGYDAYFFGDPYDFGTIFELNASNSYALTTLHRFFGPDGAHPSAAIIADASGNLYGATAGYNDSDFAPSYPATIFKLDAANGYTPTTLHSFAYSDGYGPSELIADAFGDFYGTTAYGGAWGDGVVYSLVNGVPAPVTGITPSSGPSGGGTPVTVTGTGFSAAVSVRFGGTFATGVTVVNPTEVTAVTPPLPPGKLIDVAVTNAIGNAPGGPSVPSGHLPRRRREGVPQRHHGRMRRRQLLPQQPGHPSPDGRLPPEGRTWIELRAARLHRHLRRRAVPEPIRSLDRTALSRGHHRRLRRRQLLPRRFRHTGPDGGIPPQGRARIELCAARLRGHLRRRRLPEPVCRLDRAAFRRGHHRRLRRRELLPGQPGQPRTDGGVPRQDLSAPVTPRSGERQR
jgi:uncharacterized repeat protein (TIGR03803 family)